MNDLVEDDNTRILSTVGMLRSVGILVIAQVILLKCEKLAITNLVDCLCTRSNLLMSGLVRGVHTGFAYSRSGLIMVL